MSAIKVNFEIGHKASLRSKKTPEGFTHDWEVFVRGQEGADISHFVEKVVFHLHETFPKPRRVVKEPPFSVKESGYAGFIFPIEIYLKNKDEPKKIKFAYDFTLQQSGILKDRYVFQNPNDEFRKKLLRGGGILVNNNAFYTNPDQESRSRDSFTEDKQQLISKPKLSSENIKKHKIKEHKEEVPLRTSSFENLFGPPIQKPPKVSPDPKKLEKNISVKSDKKERDRSNSEKKSKHENDESKEKKSKDEKEKLKSEKLKMMNKEQEKPKEKASKRPSERPMSPVVNKKRCDSPPRRPPSPPVRSSSASSMKEEFKSQKTNLESDRKSKQEDKPQEHKSEKEVKEKKKKEKKSHDRDKERKEKKEHKKESHKIKESSVNKEIVKELPKDIPKPRDTPKERETIKEVTPVKEKLKQERAINKFSIENLQKTPPQEIEDKSSQHKSKDKPDSERKHKHKKKDKKRDESREKHKDSTKEKKHRHEKVREIPIEKPEVIEHRETPVHKELPPPDPGSPISIDTASQCSSKSGLTKILLISDDINSSHSDSESSVIPDEEEKPKLENPSPEIIKHEPSPEPEPEPEPEVEPELEPEIEPIVETLPPQPKEKSKKHKDKSSKKEERRRKRKAAEEEDAENRKVAKTAENVAPCSEQERGESSGSVTTETKVQDNGVSSSLGEDAEPGDLSPDYMVQLRDLQQRIMKIKNNEDLERVVNLIAETGRYEVTTQTFDFDLCLLDRSTVQQLIQLVGC